MRFKKGEKVEVMNKGEAPVAWRVAEILSGNGYTYRLRYDSHPGMESKKRVYTVSRKLVRPCPPMVQGLDACVAGDIVEVSHEYSWKIGAILKVLGSKTQNQRDKIYLQGAALEKQYLVRLLGSSQELIMDGSKIRMRQTWHGDKWILMRKSSRVCEEAIAGKPLNSNRHQKMDFRIPQPNARVKRQPQKDCAQLQNDAVFWESPVISSRSLKMMSPYGSSIVDARNGCTKRAMAFEKDDLQQGVFAPTVLKKVDAVAYPRELLGEKNMHASFNIISDGYNHMQREKLSNVLGFSGVRNSELSSSDSDACSVGSCSVASQSPNNYHSLFISLPCREDEALCSDAESCSDSSSERKGSSIPPKGEVEFSIRRLELHAYRSTLEALYASGPLSWEQEALLTNLRIMLHISNDEHLMELKHLISTHTSLNVR